MKQLLITLGDVGDELKSSISLEVFSNIIGSIDLINVDINTFERLGTASFPPWMDEYLVEFIKKTLLVIIERFDKLREQTKRIVQIHSIDLLTPDDWYYIQVNYFEKEPFTRDVLLQKLQEIQTDTTDMREIKRRLAEVEQYVNINWK